LSIPPLAGIGDTAFPREPNKSFTQLRISRGHLRGDCGFKFVCGRQSFYHYLILVMVSRLRYMPMVCIKQESDAVPLGSRADRARG
jgi:hypothetical protein